jgi:hypothetical protein
MTKVWQNRSVRWAFKITIFAMIGLASASALADDGFFLFLPGNLVVSRSVYDNNPNNVTVGQTLPVGCVPNTANKVTCGTATANGSYPQVFNNDLADGSFGITSKIFLDQITPFGFPLGTLQVPNNAQFPFPASGKRDQLVTSFSSKSELALNLATDHRSLTFMGYVSPIDALDVSNSNTPAVIDPTNPVPQAVLRGVADVDGFGDFHFTETNAYSGNNGRAAILNSRDDVVYTAGNAGNGGNPQPDGVIVGTGAQILTPSFLPEFLQNPGTPTPVGSFNITQLPANTTTDKIGKDTNFRGLTIFNNVVYFTKGSGGNGINTVYFIDTTGKACPGTGVGVPQPGAALPNSPIAYDPTVLQTEGVTPYNMCILSGFNTVLASTTTNVFPFGIWFADANTLYVADEGDGYAGGLDLDTHAAAQTTAGLQKWVFNGTTWTLAYTLQNGLALGTPYTVPGYPTGLNLATCVVPKGTPAAENPNNCPTSKTLTAANSAPDGLPWAPATDGVRNITGRVNFGGTVTIYAITSTVSGGGDQGADPNKLVAITDNLAATTLPASESFRTVRSAGFAEVLRGVSWTPDLF